ncbi:MAG TPA: hypothetical protein VMX94_12910 [Armatimonadota bacterium]|nr:hypothetical protein [Armatimonadota bacterium]
MKQKVLMVFSAIALQVLVGSQCYAAAGSSQAVGFIPVDTINMEKALADNKTSWVKHAMWPTDETVSSKRYMGDVKVEIDQLRNMLDKMLLESYKPTSKDLEGVVALADLWGVDDSDYLLLRYTTKSGLRINIQDGGNIFMLVTLPDSVPLSDVESLVKKTAETMLDLSKTNPENRDKPTFWTWSVDIGPSVTGKLRYGHSPETNYPDWYTTIGWWSDGRRVLLQLSKFDFKKLPTMCHVPPMKPRKFNSRVQTDKPNE